jgi:hypothetical protein
MSLSRRVAICLSTCLVLSIFSPAALGQHDPKVDKLVSRGLDWIASTQSRLGHWSANDGRYPTAMTALAGTALLSAGSTYDELSADRGQHERCRVVHCGTTFAG